MQFTTGPSVVEVFLSKYQALCHSRRSDQAYVQVWAYEAWVKGVFRTYPTEILIT